MNSPYVLVVSSSASPNALLQSLELDGIAARSVDRPNTALELLRVSEPAVVIMDLNGRGIEGLKGCRLVAAATAAPIVIWANELTSIERIAAMMVGAAEILPPTLSLNEVSIRLGQYVREKQAKVERRRFQVGNLIVDLPRRQATVDGRRVPLTKLEFTVLAFLSSRNGEVCTRSEVIAAVWGPNWVGAPNVLDTHIVHIRAKLLDANASPVIATVRGFGYCIEAPGPDGPANLIALATLLV